MTVMLLLFCRLTSAYEPGHFYSIGHTKDKAIALTFDDGPGPITPSLLKLLQDHHIRATFFLEGTQVERYASIAREVAASGEEIGNHTYKHFNYHRITNATPERLVHELEQEETTLRRALRDPKFRTKIVRMPYGYMNHTWLLPTLKAHGYSLVHWSFDKEIRGETAEQTASHYIQNARPGAVFLFHDGGRHREKMLEAVTTVITTLEQRGYRFVSADEMFNTLSPAPSHDLARR
jgi:peptidoglycan/xylan/chitin deacetylase (PgdA/CDA1 family)